MAGLSKSHIFEPFLGLQMGAAYSQSFLCGPGGDHIDEDDGGHNDL